MEQEHSPLDMPSKGMQDYIREADLNDLEALLIIHRGEMRRSLILVNAVEAEKARRKKEGGFYPPDMFRVQRFLDFRREGFGGKAARGERRR